MSNSIANYNPGMFGINMPQPLTPTPNLSFGSGQGAGAGYMSPELGGLAGNQQITMPGGMAASMDWLKANQQPDVLGGAGAGASPLGFGMNLPTLQLGMGALQTGAGLYTGLQALGLANKQYKLSREMANANLNNSISSYNTSLEDRVRARYGVEGKSQDEASAYVNSHKMTR
jgi:hypothetical protein